jgi:hypothetical protein
MMERREFLKKSLFGGLAITIPETIISQNSAIESGGHIAPKSRKPGALALAFGTITGSRDFPLRDGDMNPRNVIATDGTRIYFLWPSERGDARGYIVRHDGSDPEYLPDEKIVFRLRMGRPEAPYYLRWKNGDYYLYTPPGALVKRAAAFIRECEEGATLQALSDMRMAILINLTFSGDGQDALDELCELDKQVRESADLSRFWETYKSLLSKTNPSRENFT